MIRKIPTGKNRTRARAPLPTVTIIGCGNWGTTLAFALNRAGVPLREVIVRVKPRAGSKDRAKGHSKPGKASDSNPDSALSTSLGTRVTTLNDATLDADVLWICTPDAAIAGVAEQLAVALTRRTQGKRSVVFHSSGALASSELAVLQKLGASIASVHPLMTFPRVASPQSNQSQLAGIPFAVEGDARASQMARKLVRALGGEAFTLSAGNKPLYHAFGSFASPLLIALLTAAMETAVAAGYTPVQARRRMRPIVERTVFNFFTDGPGKSFSGPIARGDTDTIAQHLGALLPHPRLLSAYRELARFALESLPAQNKERIQQLLRRTS